MPFDIPTLLIGILLGGALGALGMAVLQSVPDEGDE